MSWSCCAFLPISRTSFSSFCTYGHAACGQAESACSVENPRPGVCTFCAVRRDRRIKSLVSWKLVGQASLPIACPEEPCGDEWDDARAASPVPPQINHGILLPEKLSKIHGKRGLELGDYP